MRISDSVALVTGANRGLGHSLVRALLSAGVRRVYAAGRRREALEPLAALDRRVEPLILDVTDGASITRAAELGSDVDLLFNNAGTLASAGVLTTSEGAFAADMAVNFYGPLAMVRAFLPALERRSPSAVVNVLSVAALSSMPPLGGYSASKAAAFSLTQSLRGELSAKGIRVFAVFPGPVDTDMIQSFRMEKASPDDVARAIVEGVREDELDILPDAMSKRSFEVWRADPRELERRFGGRV